MTEQEQKMICIVCPRGCRLTVGRRPADTDDIVSADDIEVSGNACPRGAVYARQELTDPRRNISSTIRVLNGQLAMLPVKTDRPIPKDRIFAVMRAISRMRREAPILAGEVILENAAGTGCNIVACRRVERQKS